ALRLAVVDLTALAEEARSGESRRRAAEEAQTPFDLAAGPLVRATLLRLDALEHVLLLTMHHIVSDGWSRGVVMRELAALYRAFTAGSPSPLPELSVQYADYAAWQRAWLQGEVLDRQLAYWRKQLDGLRLLQMPTDRPRPAIHSYRGRFRAWTLPSALLDGLKGLSQSEGATLFMTLLAAFQALLHRYTGQDEVVVGSPIAGRTRSEVEGLIGFFVNSLVLRTDLSGDPRFLELLGRVREVVLGAFAHQDVPFEKLTEELEPERHLGQNPFFQVAFAVQNAPFEALALEKLTLSRLEFEATTARFDIEVHVWERDGALSTGIFYSTDLYDAATIERLFGHFRAVLEAVAAEPGLRVSRLPLLSADEQRLLREWNDTAGEPEPSPERTVVARFEAAA